IKLITVGGNADYNLMMENSAASKLAIEQRAQVTIPVSAGSHVLTATFIEKTGALEFDQLQPFARLNFDPVYLGGIPSVANVSIRGPFAGQAPAGSTASSEKVFSCLPQSAAQEEPCAREILTRL